MCPGYKSLTHLPMAFLFSSISRGIFSEFLFPGVRLYIVVGSGGLECWTNVLLDFSAQSGNPACDTTIDAANSCVCELEEFVGASTRVLASR